MYGMPGSPAVLEQAAKRLKRVSAELETLAADANAARSYPPACRKHEARQQRTPLVNNSATLRAMTFHVSRKCSRQPNLPDPVAIFSAHSRTTSDAKPTPTPPL
eukprot:514122-Rhodomonas_salina.1